MEHTKKTIVNLTYASAQQLWLNGAISADAWEWYCWKFGQTSLELCRELRGTPEPRWLALGDMVAWQMADGNTMCGELQSWGYGKRGIYRSAAYVKRIDGGLPCGPIDTLKLRPASEDDVSAAFEFFKQIGNPRSPLSYNYDPELKG